MDFTKHRIRISRYTLKCLGNPDYVRLLINPETRSLAIEVCDHTESRGHRIPDYVMNSKQSYGIYSATLMEQLLYHTHWDDHCTYKMFATAQVGKQLMVFKFDESFRSVGGALIPETTGKREGADEVQAYS